MNTESLDEGELLLQIASEVFRKTGIRLRDLKSHERKSSYVTARQMFSAIARGLDLSFPRIAEFLGGRNHTSIVHLCNKEQIPGVDGIIEALKSSGDFRFPLNDSEKARGKYALVYKIYEGKCAVCKFDEVVEVHHRKPRRAGGGDNIENLILLCPNHHAMADRGMLFIKGSTT